MLGFVVLCARVCMLVHVRVCRCVYAACMCVVCTCMLCDSVSALGWECFHDVYVLCVMMYVTYSHCFDRYFLRIKYNNGDKKNVEETMLIEGDLFTIIHFVFLICIFHRI